MAATQQAFFEPATLTVVPPPPAPPMPVPIACFPVDPEPVVEISESEQTLALRREELTRARSFGPALLILCGIGLFFIAGDPNHTPLRTISMIALAAIGGIGAFIWYEARRGCVTAASLIVLSVVGVISMVPFELHLGVFSPVSAGLVFGLGFLARSEGERFPIAIGLGGSFMYLAIGLLVAFDVVPDVSVFNAIHVSRGARVTTVLSIEAISLLTVWHARASRRAVATAIVAAAKQARELEQHRAQLVEAHQVVEVLVRRGEGRFTGRNIGGWELGAVIGRGAMGEVYAGRHVAAGIDGAVKLMSLSAAGDLALVKRFVREAQIASRLAGPNLVRVFDVGTAPDGGVFIAMEKLAGRDLAAALRESPRISLADALALADDVGRGLDVAHGIGIVHRDLKPANLFFDTRTRAWKILDFGIAKLGESSGTLTEAQIIGTPGYLAPEQATCDASDHRGDIFSLGAVLYRVLTGRAPFGGSGARSLHAVVFEAARRPSLLAPELPRDVELVLAIALAKKPEDRFGRASDLSRALRAASRGQLAPELRAQARAILADKPWAA